MLGSTASASALTYEDPDDAPYDLGTPPSELEIEWPAPPEIEREVTARTIAEANAGAATAGTRVHVTGALEGDLKVTASDVEIEFAPNASAGSVQIGKGLERIAVRGGDVDHVEMELPAVYDGELKYSEELMTTDVLLDAVEANAEDTAFLMRAGKRIAITNSHGTAGRYSVWFGDSGDFESEDVILAGNEFSSEGPEATVRLVHVVRSATVDNRLENGAKHNYRTHGRADLNWASGNVLINSGIMLGTMADDSIGKQWFENNTFYHRMPSLIEIHLDESPSVTLRRNTIYSDVWTCFLCREAPSGWVDQGNQMFPYRAPPAK
ncbi:hypothetical protein [Sandaracinus amylolyticus]|uniref:hypothetical protein n=1 Tax=Sandaracinus amylolyticus TaxID=927083 RepID=UPI001F19030C|nr:hypothetical protein [Sandaracinus amylolyticus]UJR84609.1 Hypothetical protein I5071_66880 [Sandaracinus amylolyticus]